jgi:hypothetical protein
MKAKSRLEEYKDETDFDHIMLMIRNGTIKCGKYSHLVKSDKNPNLKRKEFFTDGRKDDSDSE